MPAGAGAGRRDRGNICGGGRPRRYIPAAYPGDGGLVRLWYPIPAQGERPIPLGDYPAWRAWNAGAGRRILWLGQLQRYGAARAAAWSSLLCSAALFMEQGLWPGHGQGAHGASTQDVGRLLCGAGNADDYAFGGRALPQAPTGQQPRGHVGTILWRPVYPAGGSGRSPHPRSLLILRFP